MRTNAKILPIIRENIQNRNGETFAYHLGELLDQKLVPQKTIKQKKEEENNKMHIQYGTTTLTHFDCFFNLHLRKRSPRDLFERIYLVLIRRNICRKMKLVSVNWDRRQTECCLVRRIQTNCSVENISRGKYEQMLATV